MASHRSLALLPAGVYRASTSRCCWCALTAPLHPCLCPTGNPMEPSAVCFCGTLLTVTRTGRYPASLAIGEPGLSSIDGANITARCSIAITSPAFRDHHAVWTTSERGLCCLCMGSSACFSEGHADFVSLSDTFTSPVRKGLTSSPDLLVR